MARIHHATVKLIQKAGFDFEQRDEGVVLIFDGQESAPYTDLAAMSGDIKKGRVAFTRSVAPEGEETPEEGEETPIRSKSGVMTLSYHSRYMAQGGGCGDELDSHLRAACLKEDGLDLGKIKQIGEANSVWSPAWESLNPGMQRMNLANRLRAKLRNDGAMDINLGGIVGRFGVEFQPKASRKSRAKAKKAA